MANRKGTKKNNVTLREKPVSNGNISLYLDIYRDGIRSYEFLKLYIKDKPKTPIERQISRETYALAEQIRTKRESELNHSEFGFVPPAKKKVNIFDYYQNYIDTYTKKDKRMIEMSFRHFNLFLAESYPTIGKVLKPEQLNKDMVIGYKEYLESKSKGEGANSTFQRFKKVIKTAYNENIFLKNPCEGISCKTDDTALQKDILTIEEIKLLAAAQAPNSEVKRAFLFSLYSGIRFCDIVKLTFSNFDFAANTLKFTQAKTKGHSKASQVTMALSPMLLRLLGEPREPEEKVFNLPTHTGCLKTLRSWVKNAGIQKHITWHCARHSFAVNLLGEYKTDIKTVASLLGHSGLKHTEKYTRAVDELKKKAINSLPEIEF